jgi:hypothetical protein
VPGFGFSYFDRWAFIGQDRPKHENPKPGTSFCALNAPEVQ